MSLPKILIVEWNLKEENQSFTFGGIKTHTVSLIESIGYFTKKIEIEVTKDENFNEFVETDFDFFVYRAHVLSSKKNADILKNEIEEGGYPAFIENLENNNNLFVLYVGPFLSESDIVNNMGDIQSLSQSNNGEIVRWKL